MPICHYKSRVMTRRNTLQFNVHVAKELGETVVFRAFKENLPATDCRRNLGPLATPNPKTYRRCHKESYARQKSHPMDNDPCNHVDYQKLPDG